MPTVLISTARRKKFARSILRKSKKRSYRCIAREDYPMRDENGKPIIKHGTLNRIATTKGEYFPTDERILIALKVIKPRRRHPKSISEMSTCELLNAIRNREPMPPATYSQRTMDNFIRACKRAARQRVRSS